MYCILIFTANQIEWILRKIIVRLLGDTHRALMLGDTRRALMLGEDLVISFLIPVPGILRRANSWI